MFDTKEIILETITISAINQQCLKVCVPAPHINLLLLTSSCLDWNYLHKGDNIWILPYTIVLHLFHTCL